MLVTLLLAFSIFAIVQPASAQSIPKPSVPQFTIQHADHSYDIPETTTTKIDPYTNKTVTTIIPGRHVKNITIDLIIKNQAFPSVINGNTSNLYYNIHTKGHYGKEWQAQYSSFPEHAHTSGPWAISNIGLPTQSNSEYTVISLPANYRVDDEVDFQVRAVLGYQYSYWTSFYGQTTHIIPTQEHIFYFQTSDWSPTQTFKMPANLPIQTPTVPEFSWLTVLPLLVLMSCIALLLRRRKNQQVKQV